MNSNNDLNGKKVENDNLDKKSNPIKEIGSKIGASIEGLIVFALIFVVIVIVISTFFEEKLEQIGVEIDDEYETDYEFREYNYDPDDSVGNYSYYINQDENEVSVDELTQTELFNELLKETTKEDLKNSISKENVVEENDTTNNIEDIENEEFDYSTSYYNREKRLKEEFENAKKNLIIKDEGLTVNNQLMLSFDNQNSTVLNNLDVYAVFYSNNEIVDIKKDFIELINANSKYYFKFRSDILKHDRYEVFISTDYYSEYSNVLVNDDIKFSSRKDNDIIIIDYENNSDEELDAIEFSVLYYDKNNKLINIENNLSNYTRIDEGSIEAYVSWDAINNKVLEYDSYKVILDYAEVDNY